MGLKSAIPIILVLLSAIPVGAVEVIQREETSGGITSPLQGVVDFIGTYWMLLLVIAILFVVLMFILKWWKTQKERDNIFLRDYNRVVKLCKMQKNRKRVRERPFWFYVMVVTIFASVLFFVIALVLDDVPAFMLAIGIFIFGFAVSIVLKLAKFFSQHDIILIIGKFGSKIVGSYDGECVTSDGYKNFLVFAGRKFLFWKRHFIIKVNLNESIKVETKDKNNKSVIKEFILPRDLLVEGENVISIKGEGLDVAGYFYYPLLMDEKGNIVNMDLIAYARSRDVAMLDTLYQQTEDFVRVQREAINLNPNVRYIVKTKGESVTESEAG